ncbi:MAG: hypothetical protein K2Z81_13775 [Cyanobacteria bacterium]|nr:hypothetical protein [Cyanobacteriota bacterium]
MGQLLTIRDQAIGGGTSHEFSLDFPAEQITVRELIRTRVFQEVQEFNQQRQANPSPVFRGLVQPTEAETTLNGYKMKKHQDIDWEQQFEHALKAFKEDRIIILVNDKQSESLDEEIRLRPNSVVTFLRLTPLVGG